MKDMKEAKQLYYDRLELRNNIKYVIVGDKTDDNGNSIFVFSSNKDNPSNEKDAIVEYASAEVVKRSGFLYMDLPRNESAYPFFVSENGDLSGTLSGRIVVKCYEATNIGSIRLYIWRKKRASVSVFNGLFYPDGTSMLSAATIRDLSNLVSLPNSISPIIPSFPSLILFSNLFKSVCGEMTSIK